MSEDIAASHKRGEPPLPADAMSKFRPGPPCVKGSPIRDTSHLFSGEPCCSSCRGKIEVVEGVWVHA